RKRRLLPHATLTLNMAVISLRERIHPGMCPLEKRKFRFLRLLRSSTYLLHPWTGRGALSSSATKHLNRTSRRGRYTFALLPSRFRRKRKSRPVHGGSLSCGSSISVPASVRH